MGIEYTRPLPKFERRYLPLLFLSPPLSIYLFPPGFFFSHLSDPQLIIITIKNTLFFWVNKPSIYKDHPLGCCCCICCICINCWSWSKSIGLLPGSIPPIGLGTLGFIWPIGRLLWFCMYWLICSGMAPIVSINLIILSSRSLKSSLNSGLVRITR